MELDQLVGHSSLVEESNSVKDVERVSSSTSLDQLVRVSDVELVEVDCVIT